MNIMKISKIILISMFAILFGCSSSADKDFSRDELLKDRIEKKSTALPNKLDREDILLRSFHDDSLRLENPEILFTYFPERSGSSISAPKKVRFSMYESVHYKRGY